MDTVTVEQFQELKTRIAQLERDLIVLGERLTQAKAQLEKLTSEARQKFGVDTVEQLSAYAVEQQTKLKVLIDRATEALNTIGEPHD